MQTLSMYEYPVFKAIQNSKEFNSVVVPAVYDVLALVDRDKWYDVLARLYLIAGATGVDAIDEWARIPLERKRTEAIDYEG